MHAIQGGARQHAPATLGVHLYFIALGPSHASGPKVGCGDTLVRVNVGIPATRAPLAATFRLLVQQHTRLYGQTRLYNPLFAAHLRVQGATVVKGGATVRLSGPLYLSGDCDDPRVIAQLRATALQFHTVRRATVLLDGVPIRQALSQKGE
jgi:hypothetical protein